MVLRIAIVEPDSCQPKRCAHECHDFCPPVLNGEECVTFDTESGKAVISEEICIGCGICVKKCPFDAILIENLPQMRPEDEVHRYGINQFALFGLFVPAEGKVTGILGPNGTGKTTAVRVLLGQLRPNLGREDSTWEEVLRHFKGTETQRFLQRVLGGGVSVSYKPQDLSADLGGVRPDVAAALDVDPRKPADALSGGERQRLAIAACLGREADLYILDEITPYLDIFQRMKVARLLREVAERGKSLLVVDHDLAVLDAVSDALYVIYGTPGAFGATTGTKTPRTGINEYLDGHLRAENVRIRSEPIRFEAKNPSEGDAGDLLARFGPFAKTYGDYRLSVGSGEIRRSEVVGILGPNAIGKSTFARILAGVAPPDEGAPLDQSLKIAYKPQYLKVDVEMTTREFLRGLSSERGQSDLFDAGVIRPLTIDRLMERPVGALSGGELQRVAIAGCLARDADLYLLDEPSAHLDVEQRMVAAKILRRFSKENAKPVMVIDHDIYLMDLLCDRLIVFAGTPGREGRAEGPFEMREGMNRFLSQLGVTFRRDPTGRPRINTPGSRKDREQRESGEYYYEVPDED
jgi:ATP-binding cassette subfamily E protein 1